MISYRHCSIHSVPIDVITRQANNPLILCHNCFQDRLKETPALTGIILNNDSLQIFTTFTQFVQKKLQLWISSISRSGADAIFDRKSASGRVSISRDDWNKMKGVAQDIVTDYRNLIKANKECVMTQPVNIEILYHPQFLKDIYSLILDSWEVSSLMILNNFCNKLSQCLPKHDYQFSIKRYLVNQINQERIKKVREKYQQVVIANDQILETQAEEPYVYSSNFDKPKSPRSPSSPQESEGQAPSLIRQVESFIEIAENTQSSKSIDIEQDFQALKKKLKKSKLIDQTDYNEWQVKFTNNLHELVELKKQNEQLKKYNQQLANQRARTQEDYEIMRKKYEKILYESRERYTSGKNSSENSDPNAQLLLSIVQLEVQINNSRFDVEILADCVNECLKEESLSQLLQMVLSKKLQQLRTVHVGDY